LYNRLNTGAIIIAAAITPIIRAICCFHGVAPTTCPVFRSWRLSLAMEEIARIIETRNKISPIKNFWVARSLQGLKQVNTT